MIEVLNIYKLGGTWGSYRGVDDPYLWDGALLQMISKTNILNNHSASLQDQAFPSNFFYYLTLKIQEIRSFQTL